MKATGIVRRIDYLGRIVIPKKLMSVMDIKVRDPIAFLRRVIALLFKSMSLDVCFVAILKIL